MKTNIQLTQFIAKASNGLFVSEPLVALQPYKLHACCTIDCQGHLCFTGACWAFEKNRTIEFSGEIDRVGYFTSGEVANFLERCEGVVSAVEHIAIILLLLHDVNSGTHRPGYQALQAAKSWQSLNAEMLGLPWGSLFSTVVNRPTRSLKSDWFVFRVDCRQTGSIPPRFSNGTKEPKHSRQSSIQC